MAIILCDGNGVVLVSRQTEQYFSAQLAVIDEKSQHCP
jgi:outer membrane lipoprotein-sorting protein